MILKIPAFILLIFLFQMTFQLIFKFSEIYLIFI